MSSGVELSRKRTARDDADGGKEPKRELLLPSAGSEPPGYREARTDRTAWARDEITRSSTEYGRLAVATWRAALHSICAAPLQAEPRDFILISDNPICSLYGKQLIIMSKPEVWRLFFFLM